MSLASDFLRDYFRRNGDITQHQFSLASGLPASQITKILRHGAGIAPERLAGLCSAFGDEYERAAFLTSWLRDQIPHEHADIVKISPGDKAEKVVAEDGNGEVFALVDAFNALPGDSYRAAVLRLMNTMQTDAELRDLFRRIMDWVAPFEAEHTLPVSAELLRLARAEMARRHAAGTPAAAGTPPPTARSRSRARG